MKIYVVMAGAFVKAIFSTEEKADSYIASRDNNPYYYTREYEVE